MSTIVISNMKTGFETDRQPFLINNDAFPVLNNAYLWRGRIRKKRGTTLLGRLRRQFTTASLGNAPAAFTWTINTLYSTLATPITGEGNAQIEVTTGTYRLVITDGTDTFTDQLNGTLKRQDGDLTSTINYSTAVIVLNRTVNGANATTVTFAYFPCLPVLGLEDFESSTPNNPDSIQFDNKYSYQFDFTQRKFYSTSFYKNTSAALTFSAADSSQFWSTNYQGAMWVTNAKVGFHFKAIENVSAIGANTQFQITGHGLTNSDYVFINEVGGVTGVNGVSGIVTVVNANNFTIATPGAAGAYTTGGIAQYLTRSISSTKDGIRWYDGDNTNDSAKGWVNFSPPLDNKGLTGGNSDYLAGAKMIFAFKDRLIFFGVTTLTSTGTQNYYPNRIVYSWNGTPYYASPTPKNSLTNFTSDSSAWYNNVGGRGGFLTAPIAQEVMTVAANRDVLLCNFETQPLKLIYTGDDSFPFVFQVVSAELGSNSTFSSVALDHGVISIGQYGLSVTTQVEARRIDLPILDQVYQIFQGQSGAQRVTAVRDYKNEFIYFSYLDVTRPASYKFPNKTLLYNYRENNWALLDECFTHYGTFREKNSKTWATLNQFYKSWSTWTDPWNSGFTKQQYPNIIGGNQQGFVLIKNEGVTDDFTNYISAISGTTVTSPDHCLNGGDYILISGCTGDTTITAINQQIYQVGPAPAQNTFTLLPLSPNPTPSGSYTGGGTFQRVTNISIKTKQFPVFWDKSRQTRLGTQRFLISSTEEGQITLDVFTSQNSDDAANDIAQQGYNPYSNILFTSPESANKWPGTQAQIWHRMSGSYIGDSVQLGFRLSDSQMRTKGQYDQEIEIHAIAMDVYEGPILY